MRVSQACQCCGFGLAMSGFSKFPAACNFYSARLGSSFTTDNEGWRVCSVEDISMYSGSPVVSQEIAFVRRFAYRINEADSRIEIELVFGVSRLVGQIIGFSLSEWTVIYHVPFSDFDVLVAQGRLVLNDFVASQQVNPFLFYNSFVGVGQVVLVWPPFFEDWSNKQLTVEMSWDQPLVPSTFDPTKYEVDLRFTQSPFVFLFDDSTRQEGTVFGSFFSFYQDEHVSESGDCFTFYRARHANVLSGQVHVVQLSYRSANVCDGGDRRLRGNPSMFWAISGIWWKAFAQATDTEGQQVLTVVCEDEVAHLRPSPLLLNSQLFQAQLTKALSEWEQAFPVTVTLTLDDIDD